nr:NAD-dependent epimerase/dehydratase family protein [Puniceibacterium sp. IMCC21224]
MAQKAQVRHVLVLGANGKVGRMVRASWESRDDGPRITAVARRPEAGVLQWAPGAPLDVLPNVDAIIALWGVTAGPSADLGANSTLALTAMRVAQAVGADRVLHCSSAAVYSESTEPLTEVHPCKPASSYGAAKLTMETALDAYAAAHPQGPRPVSLRIGNVAGAESLFAAMRGSNSITLDRFGGKEGGGPLRSYIGPSDLGKVLETLALVPVGQLASVYNVSAPRPTGMELIARAAGREVVWRDAPPTAIRQVVLDTSRLEAVCALASESAEAEHLVADWQRWSPKQ